MSQSIKWGVCPEATHYLPSGFGPSLSTFWRVIDGVAVACWDENGQKFEDIYLDISGLFERMVARPMVDFSKSPEGATHFLAEENRLEIAWFRVSGLRVHRWFNKKSIGWSPIELLPPMTEAIPAVSGPDIAEPDWASAPVRATHYVYSTRETIATGWYAADGVKMRLCGVDDEYTFRLDDVNPTCGLILVERPPVASDWEAAPKDATHCWSKGPTVRWYKIDDATGQAWLLKWGEWERCYSEGGERYDISDLEPRPVAEPEPFSPDWATAPEDATHHYADECPNPWRKLVSNRIYSWGADGWLELCGPDSDHKYIPRPAVEFVSRDFGGEVRDYGPAEVDWSQGPEDATAFARGCWYKTNHLWIDGEWEYQHPDNGDHAYDYPDAQYKPEPPITWNGEGLPPVGIDCERSFSHSTWKATHICGHSTDGAYAAFYDGDGLMGWNDHCKFRPTRTPEQVASDKRIEAAQAWLKDIEREYGVEAADKCEDILMDFEKRKLAGAQS